MKRIIITIFGIVMSIMAYCQSDFEIAQGFMSKKGVKLCNRPTTRGDAGCSIFTGEDGNGFVIVSDGTVVGYSTDGTATECPVRANTRAFVPTPKNPIKPLIECKWKQSKPFNNDMPINPENGRHYMTGCSTTALGQVMYYYKNDGCESVDTLPSITFNWDLILPRYSEDAYTQEQADEISKLMKYVAAACKTEYLSGGQAGSWLYVEDFARPLGFSDKSYTTIGELLTDAELEALFDKELERERPVLMAGYANENIGHWIVVDGRDDTGRYHLNLGHAGDGDGYYIMSQEKFKNGDKDGDLYDMLYVVWCVVPIMPDGWVIPTTSTDINKPRTASFDGATYNLQGQVVETPSKGIYIRNGKKYIVRW